MMRHDVVGVFVSFCVSFCTGHFVMVPLNLTYLHCLQHSFYEHFFILYCNSSNKLMIGKAWSKPTKFDCSRGAVLAGIRAALVDV